MDHKAPIDQSTRLAQFDRTTATITQDRGRDYQHPKVDFAKANELKRCVQNCRDPLVRHVLEMLCLKMARLVHNPSHLDSWIDIAGYARCGVMVTEPSLPNVAQGLAQAQQQNINTGAQQRTTF